MTEEVKRIIEAISIAVDYGQIDGAHHKMWVIDQMVRALAGDAYEGIISDYEKQDDEWDEGIAL